MRIFVNNNFKGHWPVGTAAVVVAENVELATDYLLTALWEHGLRPNWSDLYPDMREVPFVKGQVEVLADGNY